jgi:hypothetical protein
MKNKIQQVFLGKSSGQSLVLIALAMFALVALAALLLDGGQLYMNRRAAQSAADAGALAGAYELCNGTKLNHNVISVAQNYAMDHNTATTADVTVDAGLRQVTVVTHLDAETFFAKIFGINAAEVTATATAGCFPPAGSHALPIAWNCDVPWILDETGTHTETVGDCEFVGLDWNTQLRPLLEGSGVVTGIPEYESRVFNAPENFQKDGILLEKHIYVILDTDANCPKDPTLDPHPCDFNGDGRPNVVSASDRGWLSLDGISSGTAEIKYWILNGYDGILQDHMWLPSLGGVREWKTMKDLADRLQVTRIPIFNYMCIKCLPVVGTTHYEAAHAIYPLEPGQTCLTPDKSNDFYHIIGFARFIVTCVDEKNDQCPGRVEAEKLPGMADILKNEGTIEGYFVVGYPEDPIIGETGIDMGTYVISLLD